MLFTTSWDDGYALDRRIADLLSRYGCTGTFYVCPEAKYQEPQLSRDDIRALSTDFEIGAHSMTHPRLTRIPLAQAEREIRESKTWVEEIAGKPCVMFSYPKGDWNEDVRRLVTHAGFHGARTTETLQFSSSDSYVLGTSLQVYPFPWRQSFRKPWHVLDPLGPLRVKIRPLLLLGIPLSSVGSWLSLARALFSYAQNTEQPFFHLWGHSREIEKFHMWGELEEFLQLVQNSGVQHAPNSALV